MSQRRNRPTALEVSFPDEFASSPEPLSGLSAPTSTYIKPTKKRKSEADIISDSDDDQPDAELFSEARKGKKPHSTRTTGFARYRPDDSADHETSTTIIPGEVIDVDNEEDDCKPVRFLEDFHFFDPKHRNDFVDLSVLEEDDGSDRHCEGLGKVSAVVDAEDAGQEDDFEETAVLLRLSSILRYTVDYTKRNDPFYVETQYAWYRLVRPSNVYTQFYRPFYTIHRAAQIAISTLLEDQHSSLADLLDECSDADHDILGRNFEPNDFLNAYPVIFVALENTNHRRLLQLALLKSIAEGKLPDASAASRTGARNIRRRVNLYAKPGLNLDREVIQNANQNQTTITPLINHLSAGLFRDYPYVLEYKSNNKEEVLSKHTQDDRARLVELLNRYAQGPAKVKIDNRHKIERSTQYLQQVEVGGEVVKVGDVAIVPMDYLEAKIAQVFTEDALSGNIADYFWFARILWINKDTQNAHVHWFEHSSKTSLEEISHPRELFVTPICDDYPLNEIVGKVPVQFINKGQDSTRLKDFEYFYKLQYIVGKFVDIPDSNIEFQSPPDNCPVCPNVAQFDFDSHPQAIQDGYAYHGHKYHAYDFIHYIAVDGPCKAGQVLSFEPGDRRNVPHAIVNLIGCTNDIKDNRPRDYIKDERHLYFTNDVDRIPVKDIVRKIYVVLPVTVSDLETWKAVSPMHFYVRYKFPSVKSRSWTGDFSSLEPKDVPYCDRCFSQNEDAIMSLAESSTQVEPLRALDLFAGVGAFGMGMELSCPMRVTHAIEISPSAARSLMNNSAGITVYNQCSNEMLRYAVDVYNKVKDDVPKSIEGEELSPPPQPGDIDVIIAGFPCQPHSSLNRFQRADDRKSNLILNLLSWVDFLQPRYCFFENVRGFLNYNLTSVQTERYKVEGGITMGGLKFVLRCLIAMDYQTNFALLQAGHYGLPQSRVRFFLFAAKRGEVLPEFPQPTHDFPVIDALKIKLSNGQDIQPIHTLRGTAPCHFVTIDDAIGDLPLFDWKGTKNIPIPGNDNGALEFNRDVPALKCDLANRRCGFEGEVGYRSEPTTTYQVWCRRRQTKNLQHFTRVLKEDTVNRVVHIPLRPRADYRDLPKKLWEWQISNSASSAAKGGFKGGMYGRLDKDQYFQTTVTNVEPTAKQSWVLHPECKRVVTVRELARSQGFPDDFIFYSLKNDVKTMHRQIGNAVPWPVACAIGRELKIALCKRWQERSDGGSGKDSTQGSSNFPPKGLPEYIVISDSEEL